MVPPPLSARPASETCAVLYYLKLKALLGSVTSPSLVEELMVFAVRSFMALYDCAAACSSASPAPSMRLLFLFHLFESFLFALVDVW